MLRMTDNIPSQKNTDATEQLPPAACKESHEVAVLPPSSNYFQEGLQSSQPSQQRMIPLDQVRTVQIAVPLGRVPIYTICHNCKFQVKTHVNQAVAPVAYISCCFLILFGCALCAWAPCCLDSCQESVHRCSNCGALIGKYPHHAQ